MIPFNVKRLRVQIMLRAPFFGSMLHNIKIIEDKNIPTACINRSLEVRVNPDFMINVCQNEEEQIFVICHELLHGVFLHVFRIFEWSDRTAQKIGNIAADYLVNYICKDMQLQMPKCVTLYDPKYNPTDYSLESLVKELMQKAQQLMQQLKGSGQGGMDGDDIDDSGGQERDKEGKDGEDCQAKQREIERTLKSSLASAVMQAKKRGDLPASLQRLCDDILNPKINWKEALSTWFNMRVRGEKNWHRPNRKSAIFGQYRPTNTNLGCGHIGIAVDVSGSIGQAELNTFGSELNYIFEQCKPTKVTICYFDTQKYIKVFEDLPIKLEAIGGGGTWFNIPFDYFNAELDEDISGLVFMTDGEGNWPSELPPYPLFVLCTTKHVAPYGTTVYCDLNEK